MLSEKRLALDGNAYTSKEFLAFYGTERFDSKWASATMLDSATAGTSIADDHQAVATEHAMPLDGQAEVCTVYDTTNVRAHLGNKFIGFEFERPSLPEGFQWVPGDIQG